GRPPLFVDYIKLAPLLYEIDRDNALGVLIEALSSKVVLLLGRFAGQQKIALDVLHEALSLRGYMPVIVDFECSGLHSVEETVQTIGFCAKFIVADVTDARSVLFEVPEIVRSRAVPVKVIVEQGQGTEPPILRRLRRRSPHLLPMYEYE